MAAPHSDHTDVDRTDDWWRSAAIYQVYVRSFADGDGDGTGDLAGVRARLPHLAELGIDAIWFNPWYLSPMADGGYDVADYRAIDPAFGTLAEAEKLISEARELGIRTIIDIVPNHISDQHVWFRSALAAGPGSPERELFHFRPGRGERGELPPNNWPSQFSGETWTRVPDGEWYLHLFTPEQPDLNWDHPAVRQEHEDVLRFWFERGAAGVRIDSAALCAKDPALPDADEDDTAPYVDRDELHDIYRAWRAVADEYDGVLIGELWVPDPDRFSRYLRPDELHTAFNFDFLARPWDAAELRASIDTTLAYHAPVGAPATWVLCNHDVTRTVTRYGRDDTGFDFAKKRFGTPTDLAVGTRRARAAALLSLALPGSVYLFQGEELGLPEADIPRDRIQDPMHFRSDGVDPGRDGCRVPLPWVADAPYYGFGSETGPWLPQPADWASYAADRQEASGDSMLALYREALRLRRTEEGFGDGPLTWLRSPPGALAFVRTGGLICVVNLAGQPAELPGHTSVLLTSGPLDEDGRLPQDTAVWLRT
ncbi:glycoside hydrolase family 13 protein [Streptomyces lunaelactis]|uniref:glycoside hydrolase family 13 protein n=1 Tax=Streptomyces lunaelactis TaxID=1535768 RepID=UPI0015858197|nr:glycoside hydrolase family 13 protein [Streptomyces lunaelactis]NUK09364.1 glycoside hydrolase family 13 protein [Streptomyces lunaelactis]NUK35627.1 glycoside hydrolase family 13 protein [Streptomyces lunaelactis]NUK42126.1 glycoside hydrolase family 13 protein [Streptomyces lunaelactis]NUK93800.1 glycoside hydrolase family 13 protein [Streptomyces lunaelactis]NUL10678.1 glycoside hydrolase family 13 protein [Streptomyces lunaelactis]